ncbi:competence pheromone ComX [Pontibacillus yanchengensis]|uniref:Competence pheromone ComX n=2 Tax=Pontibacillus yanchengensis TaxID=462910 RepID=A0ACC7VIK5_9BACI|nr:competence pheromone ComX [Pontibacillus yanchengensis]MYL34648.1 competence pheromone ComX [Pontibacillus yanchengensis]MYL54515.1 competence pheromone ComX [Pontibacillus yanchengensis]
MLQKIVESLTKDPSLVEKLQEGQLRLIGVSETEEAAIKDVFTTGNQDHSRGMTYWK